MEDQDVRPGEGTDEGGSPQEGAGEKEAEKGKPSDEVKQGRKDLEAANRRIAELEQSERYWAEKAQRKASGGQADDPGEVDQDPEDDLITDLVAAGVVDPGIDADKFVEELSTKGPAAVTAVLDKVGYVKKSDVARLAKEVAERVVGKERGKISLDNRLLRDFPDLQDDKSELFQETGKIYRQLVALDPTLKRSPGTLLIAADKAKAQLNSRARKNGDGEGEHTDYRDRESERDRRARAQQGDRGRGGSGFDRHDDLGPEQKEVLSRMGLTEKEFSDYRPTSRRRAA